MHRNHGLCLLQSLVTSKVCVVHSDVSSDVVRAPRLYLSNLICAAPCTNQKPSVVFTQECRVCVCVCVTPVLVALSRKPHFCHFGI